MVPPYAYYSIKKPQATLVVRGLFVDEQAHSAEPQVRRFGETTHGTTNELEHFYSEPVHKKAPVLDRGFSNDKRQAETGYHPRGRWLHIQQHSTTGNLLIRNSVTPFPKRSIAVTPNLSCTILLSTVHLPFPSR
jgi:hypothetical protein